MAWNDPDDVIEAAERERESIAGHYLPAVEWFLENRGLGRRDDVLDELAAHLDVERDVAGAVVGHLVEDDVDPVQQVVRPTHGKYVGVISHAEHDWFYAFDRYDDVDGRERRAVCAHCVREEREAADVAHFTRPPAEYDAEQARVALGLHYQTDHEGRAPLDVLADLGVDSEAFAGRHDVNGPGAVSLRDVTRRLGSDPDLRDVRSLAERLSVPEVDVEPGASLVSGTTVAGNVAWHAGNDGDGTGLNADRLDGRHATDLESVVQRDKSGNAYIQTTSYALDFAYSKNQSSTGRVTLTPATSWDVAFLATDYSAIVTLTLSEIRRNGSPLDPGRPGDVVVDVTTGDSFQFVFHAGGDTYRMDMYGTLSAGRFAND